MGTIYVFFADGFEEIEAFTTVDILRRAGLNVELVSVTDEEIVTGAHDISILCDANFSSCAFEDAEMLVLPGGMPGAASLDRHQGLRDLIREFSMNDKPIAAICAAPFILGKMGLLKGKKATCYPAFEQYLEGADITAKQVEKDGNIITGKGPGVAMEFAFVLVESLCGIDKVKELEEAMVVE